MPPKIKSPLKKLPALIKRVEQIAELDGKEVVIRRGESPIPPAPGGGNS